MKDDGTIGKAALTEAVEGLVPPDAIKNAELLSMFFTDARRYNYYNAPKEKASNIATRMLREMYLSSECRIHREGYDGITTVKWSHLRQTMAQMWSKFLADDGVLSGRRTRSFYNSRQSFRGKKVSEVPHFGFETRCGDHRHHVRIDESGRIYFEHKDMEAEVLMANVAYMADGQSEKTGYNPAREAGQEVINKVPGSSGCVKTLMLWKGMGYSEAASDAYYNQGGDDEFLFTNELRRLVKLWELRNETSLRRAITCADFENVPLNMKLAARVRQIYIDKVLTPFLDTPSPLLKRLIDHVGYYNEEAISLNIVPSFSFYGAVSAESSSVRKKEKKGRGANERVIKNDTRCALSLFVPLRWYTTIYKTGLPSIVGENFVLSAVRKMRKGMWLVRTSKLSDKFFRMRSAMATLHQNGGEWVLTHVPNGYCGHKLFEEVEEA